MFENFNLIFLIIFWICIKILKRKYIVMEVTMLSTSQTQNPEIYTKPVFEIDYFIMQYTESYIHILIKNS